ncbi:MAG: flippase-like domain-containing protein [Bacteroidales bacterium]|nr:flippase-like domain-containing protein [Bacteroidales bacterium]
MDKKISNIVKYVLSAALMVVLLWLAFRSVDFKTFVSELLVTNWWLVALSMFWAIAAFAIRALRWHLVLLPLDPQMKFWRVFDGVNIGNLANAALPFAGEFVRCGAVFSKKATYEKTLGTIALERVWDLVSIVVIIILAFILKGDMAGNFLEEKLYAPMRGRASSLAWYGVLAVGIIALLVWAVVKFRERSRILRKIYDIFAGIAQGFISFSKMEKKGAFLLYTVVLWVFYWLMTLCLVRSYPSTAFLSAGDVLFIMAVGNMASVVPVPGGMGAYHYIIASALTAIYGLTWDSGMAFATISHESHAVIIVVFGAICYMHRTLSMRKNMQEETLRSDTVVKTKD